VLEHHSVVRHVRFKATPGRWQTCKTRRE
jgi:hypothetical protein